MSAPVACGAFDADQERAHRCETCGGLFGLDDLHICDESGQITCCDCYDAWADAAMLEARPWLAPPAGTRDFKSARFEALLARADEVRE